jgi:MFS family permease
MKIRRIVDVREGELGPALQCAGVLALMIAGHTVSETVRDALFLSKLPPERLTLVYAALAVLSLLAGAASARLAALFGRRAAFVFSLQACAYGAVLLFLRPTTEVTVFILYLGSGVAGTVLALQFWMLIGQLFTVAQGKRLFGPIAAGGVLGAALGGALAAALLRFVSTGFLLLVAAGLFLAAAVLVTRVASSEAADQTGGVASAFGWVKDISALRKERYVRLVAAITVFGTAAVLVADYLFKMSAASHYADRKEDLGSFFAMFYAVQNAVALVVQLFLTAPVVRRLGVAGALLVLPVLLAAGGATVALGGGLAVVMLTKGADGSLRHSLHRVSSELLLLPLPGNLRERAKPVIDTIFGRGTQAVVAGAILGLAMSGMGGQRHLAGILALLGGLWIVTAIVIRGPYVDLFRRALARGEIPIDTSAEDLDLGAVETIMEALSSREEDRVIAAMDVLAESGRSRVLPALILYHDSPRVLEKALTVVTSAERRDWIPLAERLVDHADPTVRAGALRALAAAGHADALRRGLADEDESVRASAAFFLARARAVGGPGASPEQDPDIAAILAAQGHDGARARAALLTVIGEFGDPSWRSVVEAIVHADGTRRGVGAAAAQAIIKTGDERFVPFLVAQLGAREGRGSVREAILTLGRPAADALAAALEDPATPERVRLEIPRTLAGFRTKETLDFLTARLQSEPSGAVRFKILRALGKLAAAGAADRSLRLRFDRVVFEREARKNLVEHFRLRGLLLALCRASDGRRADGTPVGKVLLALLRDKVEQSLERAFRALGLAHRNEDIEGVFTAVVRGDKRARGNALEFLDALPIDEPDARALLRLVADDLGEAELLRRVRGSIDPTTEDGVRLAEIADHDAAVRRLLDDADDLVAALAAYHALDLGSIGLARQALGVLDERPALGRLGAAPTRSRRESAHG